MMKRYASSRYFWSDPQSKRNCFIAINANGSKFGVKFDLPGNPFNGECPMPQIRMNKRVALFWLKHQRLCSWDGQAFRAKPTSRIGMELLRAYLCAIDEKLVGLA